MNADKARIVFKHPFKQVLFNIDEEGQLHEYPTQTGVVGKVMFTGEFENLTNGYAHPLFNGQVDIETSMPLLAIPIKNPANEKVIGAIEVVNQRGVQGLSVLNKAKVNPYDLETLEYFAKILAQAGLNCYEWERRQAKLEGKEYMFEEIGGEKE